MTSTARQRRAERRSRNQSMVDMNLVSLIDVFTILIFFLLSNATGVEILPSPKAVRLPESVADQNPRETVVVVISGQDILVGGRRIASVADAMSAEGGIIAALKAELQPLAVRPALQPAGAARGPAVTLMGDKDIPFQLLRKIMVSCAQAGFSDVSFAVRQRGGGA
jgi:biopolymer transport protein ExbD